MLWETHHTASPRGAITQAERGAKALIHAED